MCTDDSLEQRFLAAITARGGELLERLDDDTFRVRLTAGEVIISIENLRSEVERDGDFQAVDRFVKSLARAPRGVPALDEAKLGLRWAFERIDVARNKAVQDVVSKQLSAVLCYTDVHEELITLITAAKLDSWGIDRGEAKRIALSNMDALLAETEIEVDDVRGSPLGMLATHSPFKASLLLAPTLRERVTDAIGWPILAVAPCRDFAYLFADEELVAPMAKTVVREHSDGAYPLTTEVLRISDNGVEAIGAFGVKPEN